MKSNSMALATVIALFFNAIGAGLAPVQAATAAVSDHNPVSFGALPTHSATIPDNLYPVTDPDTYTDGTGSYRFEGLPHGTHKVTLDPATLPPGLRPATGDPVPTLWITPGMNLTSAPLSTGVCFTAVYDRVSGDISGVVFLDLDGNGQPDPGDPALPGVRVVDPTLHQYFVPFDDTHLWAMFEGKASCHRPGARACAPLVSNIFLTAGSDGTVYYYDHWEDGYDANPLNPDPASTTEAGTLGAGVTELFDSTIDPAQIGTRLYYDGRDRITIVGEAAQVVRLTNASSFSTNGSCPAAPSSSGWLAAAWEVPEAAEWGTAYVATVGEDLNYSGDTPDDHDYSGLEVMAWRPNTEIYRNGVLVATRDAGGTYFVPGANDGPGGGGVDSSDTITSTAPIQVQMLTGACSREIVSANGYTLQPVHSWGNTYWAPVPGFLQACSPDNRNVDTDIYLHNPHSYAITVTVSSDLGTTAFGIPANTSTSVLYATPWADISSRYWGTSLSSSDTFWGMSVIDSATNGATGADDYDWGYSLISEPELSSQVVVGYGRGRPLPPLDNGNLAFVTAITDTRVYVDLNQDGLPDPVDLNGDGDRNDNLGVNGWNEPFSALGIFLPAGQVLRVGDPNDHDLMGARIYTLNLDQKIAVAWGQDPCRATYLAYLDLGYTVLPAPIPRLSKVDDLAIDADASGGVSPGDTITYTLVLNNNGMGSMSDVVLTDPLPYTYTNFVVGSLRVTTPPLVNVIEYSNDGVTFGDPAGPGIRALRVRWPLIEPRQTVTATFRVQLRLDMPVTVTQITNQAVVDSSETDPRLSEDPDDPPDADTDTPVQRPLLAIDKNVSPTVVQPGGLITYTLVISNYGDGVALLTAITDTLPSWVEYVSDTLDLTWPTVISLPPVPYTMTETSYFHGYYADDFDLTVTQTTNYAGNDGCLTWLTDWIEVNDNTPSNPGMGEVRVLTDGNALSAPAYLWMTDTDGDNAGVVRTLDLSQFRAPRLRYYVAGGNTNEPDDRYRVQVSGLADIEVQYTGAYTIAELDISAAAGNPTATLGFLATGGMENGKDYRFDHISVYETDPQRVNVITLTYESTALTYTTSTGGNPVSYISATGQMVITEEVRLPAGGVISATFQARVTAPLTDGLTLGNTACTTATNWLEILSPPCDTATIQVQSSHALTVTKTATPSPVAMGGLLTYTLHYTITGNEAVESMVVSDTTPVNTTFYAATPAPTSAPAVGTRGPVTWRVAGLWPPGTGITQATGTLAMVVRVDSALISGTLIYNAVTISDTTALTDTDEITTPVQAFADLAVSKTDDPDPVVPGSFLTYTLEVVNHGPNDAEGVMVTDTLPLEVTFVDATPTEISGPNPLVWNLRTMAVSETQTITVVVQVYSWVTQTFTNTVQVGSDTPDPDPGNNRDDEPTHVPTPGLELVKAVEPSHATHDMPFTYTLRIVNTGGLPFTALRLTDNLPSADFHYVNGSGIPADPDTIAEPLLVWSDLVTITGPLEPGESLTVTFQVTTTLASNGAYTNTASVEGVYPGGTLTDTDDAVVFIADPAVAVDKRLAGADEDDVAPNYITFTIAITNVGPSTIDVLPLLDEYDPFYLAFENATPYPDEDANDGLLTWHDLTRPAPRGFGRNLPAGEAFVVTTVFRVVRDIPFTINTAVVTDATDIYSNPADPAEDDEIIGGIPTAIELLYFRAVAEETAVRLEWATAAEVNTVGFHLYRAPDASFDEAQPIAYIPATGPGSIYSHVDRDVTLNQVYWYWLADVSTHGSETLHGPVRGGIGPHTQPYRFYLPLVQKGLGD